MNKKIKPIELKNLETYSINDRKSKVSKDNFAKPFKKNSSFADFLNSLPNILAANDIIDVIDKICIAKKNNRSVAIAMGAHVIKVGLNPILIDLVKKGIITSIALNGAGIIHDTEIAMAGQTSEDVDQALTDGSFGMARETAQFLSSAIINARKESKGLGYGIGQAILDKNLPYSSLSLLANCVKHEVPVTVHVAIGTDIIHMHKDFDPEACGALSHIDFRIFASVVANLEKGVYINIGSAVIMPEVFLKALTLVRNMGHVVKNFTAVNLDFIRHYRPLTNVVNRPTSTGGKGINIIGHHEILLPVIAAGIIERIED